MTLENLFQGLPAAFLLLVVARGIITNLREVEAQRQRRLAPLTTTGGIPLGAGDVLLHLRYPGSVWVAATKVQVLLDDSEIGVGNGRTGFDLAVRTVLGKHTLRVKAATMGDQAFPLNLQDGEAWVANISASWTGRFDCRTTKVGENHGSPDVAARG